MHIPDGFVSTPVNAAMGLVAAIVLAYSVARIKKDTVEPSFAVPLLGAMAAFVFAAQMLNFPIGGGTSGHFLGAVTAAALLGPWRAYLIMTVVLMIQGLFFGDGGITALGSNMMNMGLVGGVLCYPIMRWLRSLLPSGSKFFALSAAITSWLSVVATSAVCTLELAASGTSPLNIAFPAMVGTHAIIGIGEAMICAAVLTSVTAARPDILPSWALADESQRLKKRVSSLATAGLIVAFLLALFGSPFASAAPDGLEKVAEVKGFIDSASQDETFWTLSPFHDYQVTGLTSEKLSTSLAGLIGTMLVFAVGFVLIRLMSPARAALRD